MTGSTSFAYQTHLAPSNGPFLGNKLKIWAKWQGNKIGTIVTSRWQHRRLLLKLDKHPRSHLLCKIPQGDGYVAVCLVLTIEVYGGSKCVK